MAGADNIIYDDGDDDDGFTLLWVASNTTGPEDGEEGSFPR